ncbi:hypothetical protein Tco_0903932 [Tanacetum coccineum]
MFTERRDASEYECSSSNSSSNFEFQQMAAALEDKMTLTFRNEMNEMKNMMKAFVPTPAPIKAVEERCTTCGNNHSFNMCPMTRGGYESPVYHDNFQQFQQTASVGNFVQNGNSGYRPPNLANHTHPPGFPSNLGKPSNQGNIPHQMVPYQSSPQNSQIVLANQLDNFKKTTEGSMQAMRNHITNLKAEIRSEVQATLQNQINSLKGEFKNDQPSTSTSMVPTTLPSNTITNPRGEVRAITTRSGLSYTPVPPIPPPLYDVNEPLTEKETEVTKDKPSSAQVNNSPPSNEPSKETRLPYPSRLEREKKDSNDKVQIQKFWEMFKKIHVDITLADALILMPKYQKMLKSLLSNKEKLNEIAKTPMNANCSAVILKKLPEKLGDPGRFLIPCGFGEFGTCLKNSKGLKLDNSLIILVHGEELVIRDGLERIVFKPDGSQDNESIHMMDVYDDRVKDVCEPESNNDSATSAIVDEFARRRACFANLDKCTITSQGRVIHSPEKASISAISHIFPNNNLEDSFKMGNEDLNFIPNKELDKEILIPIPRESKIGKDYDFTLGDDFQSFKTFSNPLFEKQDDFPSKNDESILKEEVHTETLKSHLNPLFKDDEEIISNEASSIISPKATSEFVKDNDEVNHEVFKSDNENDLGVHNNKEEEIAFLDALLDDEIFFETNDQKVEFLKKFKEDFETKVEPEKKKELKVFHPDIEILNHFETNSYVGSDYVFYEDFNLVDMIFPMNIQGKIFDPGITFHEKSFEKFDKSSKELAPSKALLTLKIFDPLHPPLMDFNVTKAFFGFTFSLSL